MGLSWNIAPFRFESHDFSLSDWISLLTLALAPVLAHVVAGTPRPMLLSTSDPKWYDLICHYNPTSILWRYAAIADRRIRARTWDEGSLAATNALFWTAHGWDGAEDMVGSASHCCTRLPRHTRLKLFSWETVKTLVVTLQGVQAVILGLSNLSGPNSLTIGFSIDSIFMPLSALGLLRLLAAFWLTDDYDFTALQEITPNQVTPKQILPCVARLSMDSLLESVKTIDPDTSYFRPVHHWTSWLFRLFYLSVLLASIPVLALYATPGRQTITSLVYLSFYLILFSSSVALLSFYFIRGHTTSTIIPCISSTWYKAYSIAIMGMMLILVIVSAIETRKTPCGKYTAWPSDYGDKLLCETKKSLLIHVGDTSEDLIFGLASRNPNNTIGTVPGRGEFWVDNFTGTCTGTWSDNSRTQVSNVAILEIPCSKPDKRRNQHQSVRQNIQNLVI